MDLQHRSVNAGRTREEELRRTRRQKEEETCRTLDEHGLILDYRAFMCVPNCVNSYYFVCVCFLQSRSAATSWSSAGLCLHGPAADKDAHSPSVMNTHNADSVSSL